MKIVLSYLTITFILFFSVICGKETFAYPILRLSAASTSNSFIGYSNGELKTINSGGSFALGTTSLDFDGTLASFPDIANAFYSVQGIRSNGTTQVSNGKVTQNTQGGTIKIYADQAQTNLILEGNLGAGAIKGTLGSNNAPVHYETWSLQVTAGSILQKLDTPMLDLELNYKLNNCLVFSKRCFLASTPQPSLSISNGILDAFQANFVNGISQGKAVPPTNPPPHPMTPIPEPASLTLLCAAGLAGIRIKRKNKHFSLYK